MNILCTSLDLPSIIVYLYNASNGREGTGWDADNSVLDGGNAYKDPSNQNCCWDVPSKYIYMPSGCNPLVTKPIVASFFLRPIDARGELNKTSLMLWTVGVHIHDPLTQLCCLYNLLKIKRHQWVALPWIPIPLPLLCLLPIINTTN